METGERPAGLENLMRRPALAGLTASQPDYTCTYWTYGSSCTPPKLPTLQDGVNFTNRSNTQYAVYSFTASAFSLDIQIKLFPNFPSFSVGLISEIGLVASPDDPWNTVPNFDMRFTTNRSQPVDFDIVAKPWGCTNWLPTPNGKIRGNNRVWFRRLYDPPIPAKEVMFSFQRSAVEYVGQNGYSYELYEIELWGVLTNDSVWRPGNCGTTTTQTKTTCVSGPLPNLLGW